MSSYRDFEKENDWEWLRNDSAYGNALRFEPVSENRYEMVVTDKWASKVSHRYCILHSVLNARRKRIVLMGLTQREIYICRMRRNRTCGSMLEEGTM